MGLSLFYFGLGIINFSISIERILLNMRRTARKLGRERTLKLIEEQREKYEFFDELMH